MKGSLKIEDTYNKKINFISYYTLQQLDLKSKKEIMMNIHQEYNRKHLRLYCSCNNPQVRMSVGYISKSDTYYLKSFSKQASNHDPQCHFYSQDTLSSGSVHEKNYKEDDKGNIFINLANQDYKIRQTTSTTHESGANNNGEASDVGVSKSKLSISQLIKMLLITSWNEYIKYNGKSEYPHLSTIFQKVYEQTSKKFYLTKEVNFNSLLFSDGKIGRIYYIEQKFKKKLQPFVLFKLEKFDLESDKYTIYLRNPVSDSFFMFAAEKSLFDFALNSVRVSEGPYAIGGFVKNMGYGEVPEFISLGIVPISDWGIPIESSYERNLYDHLTQETRVFQRPIESKEHPKWNGLVPDGLLLDTEIPTIIEVFGMSENNAEYHQHRAFKIEHFSSLTPSYDLWFWDAFKNMEIPSLPPKKLN